MCLVIALRYYKYMNCFSTGVDSIALSAEIIEWMRVEYTAKI